VIPEPAQTGVPVPAARGAALERQVTDLARAGEDLPVLRAFQEFLEAERKRSRDQMIMLSVLLLLVFIAVVVAGLVAGRTVIASFRAEFRSAQTAAAQARTGIANQVSELARESGDLRSGIAAEREARDVVVDRFDREMDVRGRELKEVRETIDSLEIDNALLARGLRAIENLPPARITPAPPPPSPSGPAPASVEAREAPAETGWLSLSVPSPTGQPMTWRVPLPVVDER